MTLNWVCDWVWRKSLLWKTNFVHKNKAWRTQHDFRRWGRRFLSLATKTCCVRETHIKDFCRRRRLSISNMLEILFRRWRQKTRSLLPVTKIVQGALGLRGWSIITSHLGVGSSHRYRPISMLVLHVFRDSERDAGGGWFRIAISTCHNYWTAPKVYKNIHTQNRWNLREI